MIIPALANSDTPQSHTHDQAHGDLDVPPNMQTQASTNLNQALNPRPFLHHLPKY